MRIAYLAAGAGGMYCGSCLRDNRLAAALIAQGRDVVLVPLYTPLKTDEPDVSTGPVYYGGLNVYLEQKSAVFRHAPGFVHRALDSPSVLRRLGKFAGGVRPEKLGPLTVSVLNGEHGRQRRELSRLIDGLRALRPSLVNLPNLMFVGMAREINRALAVPVLCTLSGEDVFLDRLAEPDRGEAFRLIRERGREVDGFVAMTDYYARRAVEHFGLPADRIQKVVMGIRPGDFAQRAAPAESPFTIGYLARICPEEGLAQLAEAFIALRRRGRDCRLRAAGYLAGADRPYLDAVRGRLREARVDDAFEYVGEVDLAGKAEFLRSLHVLSVPAVFPEAKGFYVLEALASGVPVVQPREGSFPELVEATGGGLLYDPQATEALANSLGRFMDDPELRGGLAARGRAAVLRDFTDAKMADQTWAIYERFARELART